MTSLFKTPKPENWKQPREILPDQIDLVHRIKRELPALAMLFAAHCLPHGPATSFLGTCWLLVRIATCDPNLSTLVAYNGVVFGWLASVQALKEEPYFWWIVGVMGFFHFVGYMLGHELCHSHKFIASGFAFIHHGFLVSLFEHKYHHQYAGGDLDRSSCRRGVSIYIYLISRFPIMIRSARKFCTNDLIFSLLMHVLYHAAVFYFFGDDAGWLHLKMILFHVLLVDTITYQTHYGCMTNDNTMLGKQVAWNLNVDPFLAIFLFGIERHAHHHHYAGTPHTKLRMRYGKGSLVYPRHLLLNWVIAWLPPYWYGMVDPILEEAHKYRFIPE